MDRKSFDISMKSIRLDELGREGELSLQLPSAMFDREYNKVTLDFYIRGIEQTLCDDYYSNSNWITIGEKALISVAYEKEDVKTVLGFLKYIKAFEEKMNIYTDEEEDDYDFILNSISGKPIRVIHEKPVEELFIYIKPYDQLREQFRKKVVEPGDGEATLKLIKDERENQILLITAKDQEGFNKVANLFSSNKINRIELDTTEVVIKEDYIQEELLPIAHTFAEQGVYMEGPSNHNSTFYIQYPSNRIIAAGSEVVIDMKYAQNLDFDKSLVTVFFNERPIGSKKLSQENAEKDTLKVEIPEDVNIAGGMNITVKFKLALMDNYCESMDNEVPWAYIEPSSYASIRSNATDNRELEHFPYPFVEDYTLKDTTIIVEEGADPFIIANIYNTFASQIKTSTGQIKVLEESKLEEVNRESHIMVVGIPHNHNYIERLLVENDIEFSESVIAFMDHPYNVNKSMLVVAAKDEKSLVGALKMMSNQEERWEINIRTYTQM